MEQGIVVLIVGMATVFAFLVLLVAAMNGAAAFFKKFAHLFPEAPAAQPATTAADPVALAAVAIAAIRAKRG